jgi:sorbitol-specific phosphotransferase system component IIBC
MRRVLSYLALASLFTFCVLAAVWIPGGVAYLKAGRDPAEFGIPLILYSPRASFVGWLVLMVVISPALQFLVAWLGAGLSLVRLWR